jgi:hypothetical protein
MTVSKMIHGSSVKTKYCSRSPPLSALCSRVHIFDTGWDGKGALREIAGPLLQLHVYRQNHPELRSYSFLVHLKRKEAIRMDARLHVRATFSNQPAKGRRHREKGGVSLASMKNPDVEPPPGGSSRSGQSLLLCRLGIGASNRRPLLVKRVRNNINSYSFKKGAHLQSISTPLLYRYPCCLGMILSSS